MLSPTRSNSSSPGPRTRLPRLAPGYRGHAAAALVALLVLLVPATGVAQVDPRVGTPLSLAEAEGRALDLNPQVLEARLATEAADFTLLQRQAAFGTTFTTYLTERGQTSPATSQLVGGSGVTTVSNDTTSFGTTLDKALPWGGGRVSLDFNNDRTSTSSLFANFNPSYASGVAASYSQPLLRGFRIDQTREQVQQARIDRGLTDVTVRQLMAQIRAAVQRAYWELAYAVGAVETTRRSRDLAQRQLEDNQLRLELGTVTQIDVLQSRAEVAARTQAVVQSEGTWRAAQTALKQLIVADTADPMWRATLVPADSPQLAAPAVVDVDVATARALANRTDLQTLSRQRERLDLNLRLLEDQRRPAVDLNVGLSLNGVGGTQILRSSSSLGGSGIGTVPGGYSDALRTLTSVDYPVWTLGLSISVPLSTSAADAAAARGTVERRQLDARRRTTELQVAATITRLVDQVGNATLQVESAAVARELAEQRLELENARLAVGLSTTFLVLQAQRDLTTSQTAELRAQLDLRSALVDLEQAQEAP
ncbi:MAG: TolC family protein [Acidobacteria bacterium]|nr:TolC family protein [Acidobacteriota bacterium]